MGFDFFCLIVLGDVLSGTNSGGVHHAGVLEKWFGEQWWNGRVFVLLVITLGVFSPLAGLKRIGMYLTKKFVFLFMIQTCFFFFYLFATRTSHNCL